MLHISKIRTKEVCVKDTEDGIEERISISLVKKLSMILGVEQDELRVVTGEELLRNSILLQTMMGINTPIKIEGTKLITCLDLAVEHLIIPYGITAIADLAFMNCKCLRYVELPSSVKKIGNSVFKSCISLEHINIPSSVRTIGDRAFGFCKSLQNIELPEGVISIGSYIFLHCEQLRSIEIPSSIKRINDGSFECCFSLQSIKIPESVVHIGSGVFAYCRSLPTIAIPNSVVTMRLYIFDKCSQLKNIECSKGSRAEIYAKDIGIPVKYI